MIKRLAGLAASLFMFAGCAGAQASYDPLDSLSPQTKVEDALALPLQTVTLSTTSVEEVRLFYADGLGMEMTGPVEVSKETRAAQRALWSVPADIGWEEYHLTRPGAEISGRPAMSIRVLALDKPTPSVHASWDSRSLGGFSMGFPTTDLDDLDTRLRQKGFGALNTLERYEVPRTDGSMYMIHETIFNAPDFVHAVGIRRVDMLPLGAVDETTTRGGPGYSAQVVTDSDAVLAFYTDVLGLELRRDSIFKSAGADGAMSLPGGSEFRFSIVFAKGHGPGGHMLFVDFQNIEPIDNGVAPRVPNRGIGMWSFPVTSLDEVMRRAGEAGSEIVHAPALIDDPLHGPVRVATLLAPNEFLIEVYEVVEP